MLEKKIDVAELSFSEKAITLLKRAGVNTLYDITCLTAEECRQIKGMDKKRFEEILSELDLYNLEFKRV